MAYQEDLRNRLAQIQDMGSSANEFAEQVGTTKRRNKQVADDKRQLDLQTKAEAKWRSNQEAAVAKAQTTSQRQQATQQKKMIELLRKQQAIATGLQNMPFTGKRGAPSHMPARPGQGKKIPVKGNNFDSFLNAIVGQESGGNYNAINKDSGASGKYQIMPANIPQWSREALGRSVSLQQFRSSPKIQDAIASYMLRKYYNKYGAAGAAVAWYAGPGTAAKYVRNPSGYNRRQGNYPSINAYAMSILQKMGG